MKRFTVISGIIAGCAIAACAHGQAESEKADASALKVESVPTAIGEADAVDKAAPGKGSPGPGLQRLVDRATDDLALKTGIDKTDIDVVEAAYVTWANSSMGCPKPGYQYLQVLTNGSRIVLKADNKIYHYHSGKDYPPFHCQNPFEEHNLLFVLVESDSTIWEIERRLAPGERRTVTLEFAPGEYKAVCNFSGHEDRGMFTGFLVRETTPSEVESQP